MYFELPDKDMSFVKGEHQLEMDEIDGKKTPAKVTLDILIGYIKAVVLQLPLIFVSFVYWFMTTDLASKMFLGFLNQLDRFSRSRRFQQ